MNLKKRLIQLKWKSFEEYPQQGTNFYIHCKCLDNPMHKFIRVKKFNAMSFDLTAIIKKFPQNTNWAFSWLPADIVDVELCQ